MSYERKEPVADASLQTPIRNGRETGAEIARVDSSRAALLRNQAELWIRDNPDAWAVLVSLAKRDAKVERRFGMRQLIEQVRRRDYVAIDGATSVINNSIEPALARLLVEQHPEVRPFIELRRSACDAAFKVCA